MDQHIKYKKKETVENHGHYELENTINLLVPIPSFTQIYR